MENLFLLAEKGQRVRCEVGVYLKKTPVKILDVTVVKEIREAGEEHALRIILK